MAQVQRKEMQYVLDIVV